MGTPECWLASAGNWANFSDQFMMMRRGTPSASEEERRKTARIRRVPAVQRAYEFQRLLDSVEVENRAEIARQYGISRARVTQILNLLTLPGEVLDYIRDLPEPEQLRYSERMLRAIVALRSKDAQTRAFERLRCAGRARCL